MVNILKNGSLLSTILRIEKAKNIIWRTYNGIIHYPQNLWFSIVNNGMVINLFDKTYTFNTIESLLAIFGFSFIVGILCAFIVCLLILIYFYFRYQLTFKRYWKNATFKDYLEYIRNPHAYTVQTRGGAMTAKELLQKAIEVDEQGNAASILKQIRERCFNQPGLYTIGSRLKNALKLLNERGLISWILRNGTQIGIVNLDALLAQSVINKPFFSFGVTELSITVHEFSRWKLGYNVLTLTLITLFGVTAVTSGITSIFLYGIGIRGRIIASTANNIFVNSVSSFVLVTTGYSVGQAIPTFCSGYGQLITDGRSSQTENIGKIDIYSHVPDPTSELDKLPQFKNNDVDISNNGVVDSEQCSAVDLPKLGPEDPKPRNYNLRGRKPQVGNFNEIAEQNAPEFENTSYVTPTKKPTSERIKSMQEVENWYNF